MTLWFVPVWGILTATLALALIGALMMILRIHHRLKDRVGTLTPYSEKHATDLQRRVRNIVATSAEQRESLTHSLNRNDEMSAEIRAIRAALQADDLDRITENRKRTKGQSGD